MVGGSSVNKKFRKSGGGGGGGKPSFLTGRGIASATRFLNYRFHSLQTSGRHTRRCSSTYTSTISFQLICFVCIRHQMKQKVDMFRILFLVLTDGRGRSSPDRKKSILKRSNDGGGVGGGSTSVGSTSGGHLSDQDPETEKLIGEGATASESGSEPFSPLVVQRRMMMAGNTATGNKAAAANRGRPDGESQLHPGPDTTDTSCAIDDWPFADSSPSEEAKDGPGSTSLT